MTSYASVEVLHPVSVNVVADPTQQRADLHHGGALVAATRMRGQQEHAAHWTFTDPSFLPLGRDRPPKSVPCRQTHRLGRYMKRASSVQRSSNVQPVRPARGLEQGRIRLVGPSNAHQGMMYSTTNNMIGFGLPYLQNCSRDGPIPTREVVLKVPSVRALHWMSSWPNLLDVLGRGFVRNKVSLKER